MSFFKWSFYKENAFIGWDNYRRIVMDKNFRQSVLVGLEFMFWNMSISMILSFIIALCIRRMSRHCQLLH